MGHIHPVWVAADADVTAVDAQPHVGGCRDSDGYLARLLGGNRRNGFLQIQI